MGLLGKSFTSKFKSITTLAVSRIVILKNQHKARASYARSDVAQLLNLGYHDRALLRVEQWITEQNLLEVFAMIESYCNFLRGRAEVLEKNKECPVELKEATSSLIFASSRCGEFPELHKIREILTSKFGKEFADHAVELHRNNRVNSKMIQKLSQRCPTTEIKMKALKQIASEIGVTLRLEQDPILINEDKLNVKGRQDEPETRKRSSVDDHSHKENIQNNPANKIQDEPLSDRNEERKRNTDPAATVAEKALESEPSGIEASKHSNQRVSHGKMHVHPMVGSSSKQEDEVISKSNHAIELKILERREIKKQYALEESHLSSNPRDNMTTTSRNAELISKEHVEEANREGNMVGELGSAKSFQMDNNDHNSQSDAATENEHFSEGKVHPSSHAIRWTPQRSQADHTLNPMVRRHESETRDPTHFPKQTHTHHTHVDWKMMSVRTR
ncbi:IST protein [Spatholobus suberectus]|nr:IST protein [Spatholobus suberectus]